MRAYESKQGNPPYNTASFGPARSETFSTVLTSGPRPPVDGHSTLSAISVVVRN